MILKASAINVMVKRGDVSEEVAVKTFAADLTKSGLSLWEAVLCCL